MTTTPVTQMPKVLTISGSDSGGGAGIAADIKTFLVNHVYGCTAIAAVTAQNTKGVSEIHAVPSDIVKAQIEAVLSDIDVSAIKVGMLYNEDNIKTVVSTLKDYAAKKTNRDLNLVVDGVMISTGGDKLIQPEAIETLKKELIPMAKILTVNLAEAGLLHEVESLDNLDDVKACARAIGDEFKVPYTVIRGGLLRQEGELKKPETITDIVYKSDTKEVFEVSGPFVDTKNTHGAGDVLSSMIAAELAKGTDTLEAIRKAKVFLTDALRNSISVGTRGSPGYMVEKK